MISPKRGFGPLALGAFWALLAGLCALSVAQPGSSDDLFVVLVYARNLLEHGQVVHEVADGPIEGLTSPLDMLLKAGALLLGPDDGVQAAWWTSLTVYLLAILAACVAAARWASGWILLLGSTALALTPGFAEATSYLLEGPLVVLALALACPRPEGGRSPLRCMSLGVLLFLVRPELGLVALAWALPGVGGDHRGWRPLCLTLLGLAAVSLARLALFGEVVPHSFYAKASDSRWYEALDGLGYVAAFISPGVFGLAALGHLLLLLSALYLPWISSTLPVGGRLIIVSPLLSLGAVVVSGGDGYEGARLLLPFTFLTVLATIVVAARGSGLARKGATALLVTLCSVQLASVAGRLPGPGEALAALSRFSPLGERSFELEREGLRRLAEELPEGSVLASRHLQMAEYFEPGLGFLDLTGLNDRSVARLPAPGRVLFGRTSLEPALEQRVEAIHLHHQPLSSEVLARHSTSSLLVGAPAHAGLLGHPLPGGGAAVRLGREYRTVTLLGIGGTALNMNLLIREDLAARWSGRDGLLVGPAE